MKNYCALSDVSEAITGNTLYAFNISVGKNIPLHEDESRQLYLADVPASDVLS